MHPLAKSLQRLVALEFGVPVKALDYRSSRRQAPDVTLARHVWVYLLVQYLPMPDFYPTKGGKLRRRSAKDGNQKPVARMLGLTPSGVRYMLQRVEDRRDDPAFDAKITALEAKAASA